jgi:hypothetical protein
VASVCTVCGAGTYSSSTGAGHMRATACRVPMMQVTNLWRLIKAETFEFGKDTADERKKAAGLEDEKWGAASIIVKIANLA